MLTRRAHVPSPAESIPQKKMNDQLHCMRRNECALCTSLHIPSVYSIHLIATLRYCHLLIYSTTSLRVRSYLAKLDLAHTIGEGHGAVGLFSVVVSLRARQQTQCVHPNAEVIWSGVMWNVSQVSNNPQNQM